MTKQSHYPWPPEPGDTPIADAVSYGNLVFTAGQLGQNYDTGEVPPEMGAQARLALQNLKMALESAGSSLEKVLRVNIYVTDITRMAELNAVYKEFFSFEQGAPARTTVEVKGLAIPGLMVEIEATAHK